MWWIVKYKNPGKGCKRSWNCRFQLFSLGNKEVSDRRA